MKKNITVVGCGYWGKNLVRNFSELGALYSICDPNTEIANKYADDLGPDDLSHLEKTMKNLATTRTQPRKPQENQRQTRKQLRKTYKT